MTEPCLLDAYDGEAMFLVPSFSDPSEVYEAVADLRTGAILCDCKDARCRGKVGHLKDPQAGCKHAQLVARGFVARG